MVRALQGDGGEIVGMTSQGAAELVRRKLAVRVSLRKKRHDMILEERALVVLDGYPPEEQRAEHAERTHRQAAANDE